MTETVAKADPPAFDSVLSWTLRARRALACPLGGRDSIGYQLLLVFDQLPRIHFVHGPTPLVRHQRLSDKLGVDLWIKRDDATSGAEAGNKVRKLEFLLGEARAQGADTVLTCGGIQSNHARATAILAAQLGLKAILFLRTDSPHGPLPICGNVMLDRMVGARIELISDEQYADRNAIMKRAADALGAQGKHPYVIPEGGSNGLGAFGYVEAMREIRGQLDVGLAGGCSFDLIVHACGSGGTAAGVALGASLYGIAPQVRPMAVCNDSAYFTEVIQGIIADARTREPQLADPALVTVDDTAKGPAYAVASDAQRSFLIEVARLSGLILDPVYTGKALFGLAQLVERDRSWAGKRVLFLHTGGLPGLLAQGDEFARELAG